MIAFYDPEFVEFRVFNWKNLINLSKIRILLRKQDIEIRYHPVWYGWENEQEIAHDP